MARITVTTTFLHERLRYAAGTEHDVPDDLAAYAVRNGWATGVDVEVAPPTGPHTLSVDSVRQTTTVHTK